MNRRATGRTGFTLVEILLFSALGLIVVAGAWSFFQAILRQASRAERKLDAIEASLHLSRWLEHDLEHLHEAPEQRVRFHKGPDETTLEFYRFADQSPENEWTALPLVRVRYHFDPATGVATRQLGDSPPETIPGKTQSLFIQLNWGKDTPGEGLLPASPTLLFSVLGDSVKLPDQSGPPATFLPGGVSRTRLASYRAYDYWNPLPYGNGQ